jgi:hypothetical protein
MDDKRNGPLFRIEANRHHARSSALKLHNPTRHDDICGWSSFWYFYPFMGKSQETRRKLLFATGATGLRGQ